MNKKNGSKVSGGPVITLSRPYVLPNGLPSFRFSQDPRCTDLGDEFQALSEMEEARLGPIERWGD